MPKKVKKNAAGHGGASQSSCKSSRSGGTVGRSFGESKGENSLGSFNPETLSPEKLVKMGLVDLRMTKPPKPVVGKADLEDNSNESKTNQQDKVPRTSQFR